MQNSRDIYCADIGANNEKAKKFGWWSNCEPCTFEDLEAKKADIAPYQSLSRLASAVAEKLAAGRPVALGFECPLFIPFRANEMELTKGRPEDGNRAWSAGAGCGSLTTGLAQVAWVLRAIRESLEAAGRFSSVRFFLDVPAFRNANQGLLIWEAFVSGKSKPVDPKLKDALAHLRDAQRAADEFEILYRKAGPPPPVTVEPVYSLAGAALLRAGWSQDVSLLEKACVIVRPGERTDSTSTTVAGE